MHSSRMHTGHSLTVSKGVCFWSPEHPPWLCAWTSSPSISPLAVGLNQIPPIFPLAVDLDQIPLNFPLGCGPGPDPPWEETPPCSRHPQETCCKACWDSTHTPPPVNRITDTSKNITLATTSLRPVMRVTTSWKMQRTL